MSKKKSQSVPKGFAIKPETVKLICGPDYLDWMKILASKLRVSLNELLPVALSRLAESEDFPAPPKLNH